MTGKPSALADNLAGAWAVMQGRPEGLGRFDLSVEGFWRSFGAIALVAPFVAVALLSQRGLVEASRRSETASSGELLAAGLALIADWLAFPLVLAVLARPFGLASRYVAFVVARNWSAVIIAAGIASLHALHLVGILPSTILPLLLLAALGVTLRFAYLIARTTLAAPIGLTASIVVLDFLLSLFIWGTFDRFAYPTG